MGKTKTRLTLNREYTVAAFLITVSEKKLRKTLTECSEYKLAVEEGRRRQTWLPREERWWSLCDQGTIDTELHFLDQCKQYKNIRAIFYKNNEYIPQFLIMLI